MSAACDSGSSDEVGASRQEFLQRTEAICEDAVSDLLPLGSTAAAFGLSDRNMQKFRTAVAVYRRWLARLETVSPPREDAPDWAVFVHELEQLEEAGVEVLSVAAINNADEYDEAVGAFFHQMDEAIEAAGDAGLPCP